MGARFPVYMNNRINAALMSQQMRRQALSQRTNNRYAYAALLQRRRNNPRPRARYFHHGQFYDPMDDFFNAEYMH